MTIDDLALNIQTEFVAIRAEMFMKEEFRRFEVRNNERLASLDRRMDLLEKNMDRGFATIMQELKNMPSRTEFVDMRIRMDKWDRKFGAQA